MDRAVSDFMLSYTSFLCLFFHFFFFLLIVSIKINIFVKNFNNLFKWKAKLMN